MKNLEELKVIRERTKARMELQDTDAAQIRGVVGMATCGIASGARPVMNRLAEEVAKRSMGNVVVTQTGCIGLCQYEPIVEIYEQGKEKVTYVKMDPEKAAEIVDKHLGKGFVLSKYTLNSTSL